MAIRREVIRLVEGENPWATYIKRQTTIKNNCINAIAVGEPGSGKSWGVLSMVSSIDPEFTLDGNWFFKASEFMSAVKEYYSQVNTHKKGKIWVLDEAGVDLNNLSYFDEINKGLNLFFQTARHRNYVFFATVPFITFISKGVRKLMTSIFRADGYNDDNQTIFYPRILQYNDEMDKFYKRRLLVKVSGGITQCTKLLLPKPPRHLIKEYEQRKSKFTTDLFEITADRIKNFEDKKTEKVFGRPPTIRQEKIVNAWTEPSTILEIAKKAKVPPGYVHDDMYQLGKKGYKFTEVGNGLYEMVNLRVRAGSVKFPKKEKYKKKDDWDIDKW